MHLSFCPSGILLIRLLNCNRPLGETILARCDLIKEFLSLAGVHANLRGILAQDMKALKGFCMSVWKTFSSSGIDGTRGWLS